MSVRRLLSALLPVLLVAAALVVGHAVPTSAAQPTSITINASPSTVNPGQYTTLTTTLSSGGTPLRDKPVTLEKSTNGGGTWTTHVSFNTGSGGEGSAIDFPKGTTHYRWRFAGDGTYAASTSSQMPVTVFGQTPATSLTSTADPMTVAPGGTTTLGTTLTNGSSPLPGKLVTLERSADSGTTWGAVGSVATDASGAAALASAPTVSTQYRWTYTGGDGFSPSTSPIVTVSVTAQSPTALAASAAPNRTVAGRPATLRTALSGPSGALPGEQVTLYSSTGATWEAVASVTTSGSGSAELLVQPTRNTSYEWRYAGSPTSSATASATVRVLVAPRVTARLADASLARGQRLVVAGKVSPARAGHTITLLRMTGKGLRKLGRARIKADGTYRIARTLRTTGTYQVLTRVAADAENLTGRSRIRKATVR